MGVGNRGEACIRQLEQPRTLLDAGNFREITLDDIHPEDTIKID
jgi:hypothetical protein